MKQFNCSTIGLGEDGYLLVQKESAYKTGTTNSMTALPIMEGQISYERKRIDQQNIINSRIKQKADLGRFLVGPSDLTMPFNPSHMGMLMNLFIGAETAVTGDGSSTAYVHTFLMPVTGSSAGVSWTARQAIGGALADQFNGMKMTKFVIKTDNEKNIMFVKTLVGVLRDSTGVARAATVTITSKRNFVFSQASVQFTNGKAETFTVTIATPGVVTQANHGLITGQVVQLTTDGSLPTGLATSTNYYVIRIDQDTFWLATSLANALAGTKITTSGSQSGTHTLAPVAYTQKVDSFELTCDMGYKDDGATYKVGNSGADTPVFDKIPSVNFKCEIDGDKQFADLAIVNCDFAVDLTLTSDELAVATDAYKFEVEIPKMNLTSATKLENKPGLNKMSLEFEALGGVTTGSGSTPVPAEIRVTDAVATYTGY